MAIVMLIKTTKGKVNKMKHTVLYFVINVIMYNLTAFQLFPSSLDMPTTSTRPSAGGRRWGKKSILLFTLQALTEAISSRTCLLEGFCPLPVKTCLPSARSMSC